MVTFFANTQKFSTNSIEKMAESTYIPLFPRLIDDKKKETIMDEMAKKDDSPMVVQTMVDITALDQIQEVKEEKRSNPVFTQTRHESDLPEGYQALHPLRQCRYCSELGNEITEVVGPTQWFLERINTLKSFNNPLLKEKEFWALETAMWELMDMNPASGGRYWQAMLNMQHWKDGALFLHPRSLVEQLKDRNFIALRRSRVRYLLMSQQFEMLAMYMTCGSIVDDPYETPWRRAMAYQIVARRIPSFRDLQIPAMNMLDGGRGTHMMRDGLLWRGPKTPLLEKMFRMFRYWLDEQNGMTLQSIAADWLSHMEKPIDSVFLCPTCLVQKRPCFEHYTRLYEQERTASTFWQDSIGCPQEGKPSPSDSVYNDIAALEGRRWAEHMKELYEKKYGQGYEFPRYPWNGWQKYGPNPTAPEISDESRFHDEDEVEMMRLENDMQKMQIRDREGPVESHLRHALGEVKNAEKDIRAAENLIGGNDEEFRSLPDDVDNAWLDETLSAARELSEAFKNTLRNPNCDARPEAQMGWWPEWKMPTLNHVHKHVVEGFDAVMAQAQTTIQPSLLPKVVPVIAGIYLFCQSGQTPADWIALIATFVSFGWLVASDKITELLGLAKNVIAKIFGYHQQSGSDDELESVPGLFASMIAPIVTTISNVRDMTKDDIRSVLKDFGTIGHAITGAGKLIDLFFKIFGKIVSFVKRNVLGLADHDEIMQYVPSSRAWADRIHEISKTPNLKKKIDQDGTLCREIQKLYAEGVGFQRMMLDEKAPPQVQMALRCLRQELTKWMDMVASSPMADAQMRNEPYVIHFIGDSGLGKSGLTVPVAANLIAPHIGYDFSGDISKVIYNRSTIQQFWDGYAGQRVVIYDDFGQRVDSVSKPNEEFLELIMTANCMNLKLHMAELQNKASTSFQADLMILSSNSQPRCASLHSATALRRRRNAVFEVNLKDEFKGKGGMIDVDKARQDGAYINSDVYTFQQVDNLTDENIGDPLTYDEMLKHCQDGLAKALEHGKKYQDHITGVIQQRLKSQSGELFVQPSRPLTTSEKEHFEGMTPNRIRRQILRKFALPMRTHYQIGPCTMRCGNCKQCTATITIFSMAEIDLSHYLKIHDVDEVIQKLYDGDPTKFKGKLMQPPPELHELDKYLEFVMASSPEPPTEPTGLSESDEFVYEKVEVDVFLHTYFDSHEQEYDVYYQKQRIPPEDLQKMVQKSQYFEFALDFLSKYPVDDETPLTRKITKFENSYIYRACTLFKNGAKNIFSQMAEFAKNHPILILGALVALGGFAYRYFRPSKFGQLTSGIRSTCGYYIAWLNGSSSKDHLASVTPCGTDCDLCDDVVPKLPSTSTEERGAVIAESLHRRMAQMGEVLPEVESFDHENAPENGQYEHLHMCDCGKLWSHRHAKSDKVGRHPRKCPECMRPEGFAYGSDKTNKAKRDVFRSLKGSTRAEACIDQSAMDQIANVMSRNTLLMQFIIEEGGVKNGCKGQLVMVKGMQGITAAHYVEPIKAAKTISLTDFRSTPPISVEIPTSELGFRRMDDGIDEIDAVVITIPNSYLQSFEDITDKFVRSYEQDLVKTNRAAMGLYRLSTRGKPFYFVPTGRITGFENVEYDCKGPGEEYVMRVREAYAHTLPTEGGDCGGCLFALNPQLNHKIVGIHICGTYVGECFGCAQAVSYETLMRFVGLVNQSGVSPVTDQSYSMLLTGDTIDVNQPSETPQGYFNPVGVSNKYYTSGTKTQIRPSPIYGQVSEPQTKPARLKPFFREGQVVNPLLEGLKKAGGLDVPIPKEEIEHAVAHVKSVLNTGLNNEYKRVMSLEEAIRGVPGDPYLQPVNRNTSPGYPWKSMNHGTGKHFWLGRGEEYEMHPELVAACEEREQAAREGKRTVTLWMDTLKDERRPIEKVDQGKTRVFSAGPMDYLLVCRKFFLGFVANCMKLRIHNEIAVGINPFGAEWTILARYLSSSGGQMIAGDFSNYDGTLNKQILAACLDVIEDFYEGDNEERMVRYVLFQEIIESMHIYGKNIYQWTHSNPSGNMMTAILNCIYQMITTRILWLRAWKDVPAMATLDKYSKHVRAIFYGDDNVIGVSKRAAERFNQLTLTDLYHEIGMVYTNEDKTEAVLPVRTLAEVTFLKRAFVYNRDRCCFLAPRDLTSVLETINWIRGISNEWPLTIQNMEATAMELSLHPKDVFDFWTRQMIKVARASGERQMPFFMPYRSYQNLNLADYL